MRNNPKNSRKFVAVCIGVMYTVRENCVCDCMTRSDCAHPCATCYIFVLVSSADYEHVQMPRG